MRKHLTRIAILAVLSIGFISTIGAAPASAVVGANCTNPIVSATWYNGNWAWNAELHGCTAVNAVEFASAASTSYDYMVDVTRGGQVHFSFGGGGYIYGVYNTYIATYTNSVWGSGCGSPPFQIYKAFAFRLRNANNNTWGSMHPLYSALEWIC